MRLLQGALLLWAAWLGFALSEHGSIWWLAVGGCLVGALGWSVVARAVRSSGRGSGGP